MCRFNYFHYLRYMKTKKCSKCHQTKELSLVNFCKRKDTPDGFRADCRVCYYQGQKKWREKNEDKVKKWAEKYKSNNSDKIQEYHQNWYMQNAERLKPIRASWWSENGKVSNQKRKRRKQEMPFLRVYDSYRARLKAYFHGQNKSQSTTEMVGCSMEELRKHLESQFHSGMSWDNYGIDGWHIDHKTPLSSGTTQDELIKLCHYTNLQPLWAYDNLSKGDKISEEWGNA